MPEIIEIPIATRFQFPPAVQARLQFRLDRQDDGDLLSLLNEHEVLYKI